MKQKNILIIEPNNNIYGIESLEKALGGSETVFILLTEQLKKIENIHIDIVYADTFKEYIEKEGTKNKEYDLVISYRNPQPLFHIKGKVNAVYLQDFPNQYIITLINILIQQGRLNKLVFLSQLQKLEYLKNLKNIDEGRHCLMLDNCINLSLFDSSIEKQKEFIYASAPNRGLDVLLDVWKDIHKQLPNYTLKIAGSVKMYNVDSNSDSTNKERENFLNEGQNLYNKEIEGVKWLGGLNHRDIIKEFEKSKAMLYPSTFQETCCHTLNISLHAGCVPVVSSIGSLAEKVIDGENGLVIKGDPNSSEFKTRYIKSVVDLIKSNRVERMVKINRGNYQAFSSERIANRLITQLLNFDDFEGINTRILGVICTNKDRKEDYKSNFRNIVWYAPLDMITYELYGMPLDHARNIAAGMAVYMDADWILFLDDDIYVDRNFLTDIIKKSQDNGADVVVCNYPYREEHSLVPTARVVEVSSNRAINCYELTEEEANDISKYRFVTAGLGAVLISVDTLKKLGRPYFRTQSIVHKQTGEDLYFFQECHSIGAKVYLAQDIPIIHGGYGKQDHLDLIKPQINKSEITNGININNYDSRYYNIIRYCIRYIDKGNILDLGCGGSNVSDILSKIRKFNVKKLDIIDGIGIIKHDLEKVPYPFDDETFNGIICSEVLEHLYNPYSIINESHRILKKDGIMILTVPNLNSIDNILNRYQNLSYNNDYKMSIEHIRNYNIESIRRLINGKFNILEITGNSPNMNQFFDNARKVLSKHIKDNKVDEVIGDCFPDICMGILFCLKKI